MKKIVCLNKISKVGLRALPKNYQVVEDLNSADAILVRSANMFEMKLPETVIAVARAGAGVNNIPLNEYAKQGVVVFNTPGANANAVKELTIAGMLLAARDIYGGMNWVNNNKDDVEINKNMEKAKAVFAGTEIMNKTLGVIGLGAVGAYTAQAGGALGMKVIGVKGSSKPMPSINKNKLPSDFVMASSIEELYEEADYITLCVPLNDRTRGMINKTSMAMMKDGVTILNLSRDAVVNDDDIEQALIDKKVHRYVTDFPNHKTANMAGVIAFPHLGASTEEAEDNCAFMASNQLVDFIENGNITNSVNYPSICAGPILEGKRLVILHENNPEIEPQIRQQVSAAKSIIQLVNANTEKFSITIVDFKDDGHDCQNEHQCLGSTLKEIPGVIRIRAIKSPS